MDDEWQDEIATTSSSPICFRGAVEAVSAAVSRMSLKGSGELVDGGKAYWREERRGGARLWLFC